MKTLTAWSKARKAPDETRRRGGSGGGGGALTTIGILTLFFDLDLEVIVEALVKRRFFAGELDFETALARTLTLVFDLDLEVIVEALVKRRLFASEPDFETALARTLTFADAAFFLDGAFALTCFLAMAFVFGLAAFRVALVVTFLDGDFAVFFTAFLTAADFFTGLATFAETFLLCFETEAVVRPEATCFRFNSFRFFEADLGCALVVATLDLPLLF